MAFQGLAFAYDALPLLGQDVPRELGPVGGVLVTFQIGQCEQLLEASQVEAAARDRRSQNVDVPARTAPLRLPG